MKKVLLLLFGLVLLSASAFASNWCNGADIDMDGTVGNVDRVSLGASYGSTDCSVLNNWCFRRDINRDGRVNVGDLGILGANYGRTDCAPTVVERPCPFPPRRRWFCRFWRWRFR